MIISFNERLLLMNRTINPTLNVLGANIRVQGVWEAVQTLLHSLHPPADPLKHKTVPLPVLRQEIPPEVRYEETHLHSHR